MGNRLTEFDGDPQVVVVTFTPPENIADWRQVNSVPFPLVSDPDRIAYRAFGLGRGSNWRVWGPAAAGRYVELFRAGGWAAVRSWRRPTEDQRQLGGDFIVDHDGVLRWGFWGEGPDDRPDINELSRVLYRLSRHRDERMS